MPDGVAAPSRPGEAQTCALLVMGIAAKIAAAKERQMRSNDLRNKWENILLPIVRANPLRFGSPVADIGDLPN